MADAPGLVAGCPATDTMRAMESSPQAPVRLSVSIVVHNSSLELLQCLLLSLSRAADVARGPAALAEARVVVLDNSEDPDVRRRAAAVVDAWPQDDFFRVDYRALPDNRGFGAAHNCAIKELDSDFHLVLNPDAELAEDALRIGLSRFQADSGIVLLSPRVSSEDGAQEKQGEKQKDEVGGAAHEDLRIGSKNRQAPGD